MRICTSGLLNPDASRGDCFPLSRGKSQISVSAWRAPREVVRCSPELYFFSLLLTYTPALLCPQMAQPGIGPCAAALRKGREIYRTTPRVFHCSFLPAQRNIFPRLGCWRVSVPARRQDLNCSKRCLWLRPRPTLRLRPGHGPSAQWDGYGGGSLTMRESEVRFHVIQAERWPSGMAP